MALQTRVTDAARNAAVDAITALINAGAAPGVVEIRSGTQPADADDADVGTLLASVTLNDPAFGASSAGTATADIAPEIIDASADATGTATWFRVKDSNGVKVLDGSCGTSSADMILNTTSLVAGVAFEITAWTITMPAG